MNKYILALTMTVGGVLYAQQYLEVPPMPPTPPAMQPCVVTNVIGIIQDSVIVGDTNTKMAVVKVVPKDCPKVWYYAIVNGERRQWCVHDHDVAGFEAGVFEAGIIQLWRTKYHIEDLTVIKVKEQQPRVWKIPAQVSK